MSNGESMKKTYKLTPAQRLELVQLYIAGHKLEYIAALLGIRRESVSKLALRAGAPHRCPHMRRKDHARPV
jgi:DNA-directed RNA polymerase specialized sigma24 family protein